MLLSDLVHDPAFHFDGTNYNAWKIRMLNYFWVMDPHMEKIVEMGFSPPKDPKNPTLEEEKKLSLNSLATNALFLLVSLVVIRSIMPLQNAHDIWTKLQEKYGVSNIVDDDYSPSTSGRDEFSTSSTSPYCGKQQTNEMVSSDRFGNNDSELIIDDPSSLSCCHASSLDLNTTSTKNILHAFVDSTCISCPHYLSKSHDDMLVSSHSHDKKCMCSL